jgi:hypothetical protein
MKKLKSKEEILKEIFEKKNILKNEIIKIKEEAKQKTETILSKETLEKDEEIIFDLVINELIKIKQENIDSYNKKINEKEKLLNITFVFDNNIENNILYIYNKHKKNKISNFYFYFLSIFNNKYNEIYKLIKNKYVNINSKININIFDSLSFLNKGIVNNNDIKKTIKLIEEKIKISVLNLEELMIIQKKESKPIYLTENHKDTIQIEMDSILLNDSNYYKIKSLYDELENLYLNIKNGSNVQINTLKKRKETITNCYQNKNAHTIYNDEINTIFLWYFFYITSVENNYTTNITNNNDNTYVELYSKPWFGYDNNDVQKNYYQETNNIFSNNDNNTNTNNYNSTTTENSYYDNSSNNYEDSTSKNYYSNDNNDSSYSSTCDGGSCGGDSGSD